MHLTLDEVQVLLQLVRHDTLSPEFAAQWAREQREDLRARRRCCWPREHTDRIITLLAVVTTLKVPTCRAAAGGRDADPA